MTPEAIQKIEMLKAAAAKNPTAANINNVIAAMKWIEAGGLEQEPPAIQVDYYLAKLDVEQLKELSIVAHGMGKKRCAKLGTWLLHSIEAEVHRRRSLFSGTPQEAFRPDATELVGWDDATVGQALLALHAPSYAVHDPDIGQFIDKLNLLIVTLASRRLSQTGGNQNGNR